MQDFKVGDLVTLKVCLLDLTYPVPVGIIRSVHYQTAYVEWDKLHGSAAFWILDLVRIK